MPIHDWTRVEAGIFHDFHTTWIPEMRRRLKRGLLPAGYYATVEQVAEGPIPDVLALKRESHGKNGQAARIPKPDTGNGVVALAEAAPRVAHRSIAQANIYAKKARTLVIRHVSGDQIIAVIEIVSPGNKQTQGAMRSFVTKNVDFIQMGVHVLIIDLFPPTPRDPNGIHSAIWEEIGLDDFTLSPARPLILASYSAGEPKQAFVEPVAVGEALPEMPLFLEPDLYINLPLEESYQTAFADLPDHWRELLESSAGA